MEVEEIDLFLVPELKVESHHPLHLHYVVWQGDTCRIRLQSPAPFHCANYNTNLQLVMSVPIIFICTWELEFRREITSIILGSSAARSPAAAGAQRSGPAAAGGGEVATNNGCCPAPAGDDADGRRGRRDADGGRQVDGDACVRGCEIQATRRGSGAARACD